jgi:hypothetical protein
MSEPTAVNSQITDSVTHAPPAAAYSQALASLFTGMTHSISQASVNAVTN